LMLLLLGTTNAIYPDDHWTYSKELTVDNFKQHVQDEIDADRTLFVRWIASPGWGWWRKQAPAWNDVVKTFKDNPDVSFGDVNLKEAPIRDYGAGKGGWPTIRYFNKETGPQGAPYEKKTDQAMCDELGPKGEDYMTMYVEEAGNTSLCGLDGSGCDEKSKKYIKKMEARGLEKQKQELERLNKMDEGAMTPDLKQWLNKRQKILKLFLAQEKEEL